MEEKKEEMLFFENRHSYDSSMQVTPQKIKEIKESYHNLGEINLTHLRKTHNRVKNISYFENILQDRSIRIKELQEAKAKGKKVIGTFCIHAPEELIYAAGAIPLRLSCGHYDSIAPAEEIIPKNTCPLIKSSVGFNLNNINPLFQFCDAIIVPTSCDGKKKMAEILSNKYNIWTLDLPQDKENSHSEEFWRAQINTLKERLEKITGNKITKKSLKESIVLLHKRVELVRTLFEMRKYESLPINGRDVYIIMQVAFFDDIRRWMEQLSNVLKEVKENIINKKFVSEKGAPKIILTGSPLIWPNMKILNILEESGAIIVGDDTCVSGQYFYNPVETDDWSMKSMIEAIADKALLPSVCPIFTHSDDRMDKILELIEQYNADGVVYHLLRLCQVFDFEYSKISKVLEKKGIPVLKIETEYSEEDVGQIKTRIEAFIEMMGARK
ncbi:MAG: double-cubane-cluster-containing anaerobic reductase [Nanobdellota archaeon]